MVFVPAPPGMMVDDGSLILGWRIYHSGPSDAYYVVYRCVYLDAVGNLHETNIPYEEVNA